MVVLECPARQQIQPFGMFYEATQENQNSHLIPCIDAVPYTPPEYTSKGKKATTHTYAFTPRSTFVAD